MRNHNPASIKKYFYLFISTLFLVKASAFAQIASERNFGPNLVKNHSFESGTNHWNIPGGDTSAVSGTSYIGTSSLKHNNTDPNAYKMITQEINVQPGQHLMFSVWVKGQGIAGPKTSSKEGAGIFMESYDAGGKFIRGSYPATFNDTYEWRQTRSEFTVPENATKTIVGVYFRKNIVGTAWFDDVEVRVEAPLPLESFLQYPNYRGLIKQGDKTPWEFLVLINKQKDWRNNPVTIDITLHDGEGRILLQNSNTATTANISKKIIIDAPKNLPLGNYTLKQTVTDPNGIVQSQKQHAIQVVAEMPKVYIDAQGFTVVNGERFFPLGLFLGPTEEGHLQRISQGGFNTILTYAYGAGKDFDVYMKRADKHNLKVIYSLKDMYPGLHKYDESVYDLAASYVKSLRDSENLLAWYTNDELGDEWLPKFEKMYEQIKVLDPDHPTFQVLYQLDILKKYLNVTDVLATDPYPVGSPNLTRTSTNTRRTASVMRQGMKGVWMVPQLMDWAVYQIDRKSHPPSLDEMRNQAYQAIINGATGLIFYSYYDLMYEKRQPSLPPRHESARNMDLFKKRWEDTSNMAHEIKGVIPVVLGGEKVPLALPVNAQVEASAWEYQNELFILLANPYYEEHHITFALPRGWKIEEVHQGDVKSNLNNGQVTFTLPSIGSGVFKFVRN